MAERPDKITVPGEVGDEANAREEAARLNERTSTAVADTPQAEREAIIEIARRLDPAGFDTDAHVARPGKYEGAIDLQLVVALDIINGHGFADENAGEVALSGYAWRVGRFVGIESGQGFIGAEEYPTEGRAADRLHDFDVACEEEES
jgi:hypothetical protein